MLRKSEINSGGIGAVLEYWNSQRHGREVQEVVLCKGEVVVIVCVPLHLIYIKNSNK